MEERSRLYEDRVKRYEFKQVLDLKIELEKWKDAELKSYPRFREKEVLLSSTIAQLMAKAAQKIVEEVHSAAAFETKYIGKAKA